MKLQEINAIIEETFSQEIKSRILNEQNEMPVRSEDPYGFGVPPQVMKLKSIINTAIKPLEGKITSETPVGNNGLSVKIEGISGDELMSCCGASSVDDAIRILNKSIHNGLNDNSDVDINIDEVNGLINLEIKIKTSKDLESNMKNINESTKHSICECGRTLAPTEEMCECGKTNPYFITQEQAVPCEECGDEEMTEQTFEPASKETGKGKYGTKENELTDVFNESELSGVNEPNEYGHTDLKADTINETKSGKKVVRMSEEKFKEMIKKIVTEAQKVKTVGENPKVSVKTKPFKNATKAETKENIITEPTGTIPGLKAVKTAHNGDSKEEKEYFNSVDEKMKDYLNFEGNDIKEPETGDFPAQIGEGDKVAHRNTTEEEEYIDTYRGMKPQDAVYDTPPSKEFTDRVKKALMGDSTMGNKQDKDTANISLSDLGEKLFKDVKKKRDAIKNDPMYVKDKQPVEDADKYQKETGDLRTVAEDKTSQKVIEEEIKRMKLISSYGKKTQ